MATAGRFICRRESRRELRIRDDRKGEDVVGDRRRVGPAGREDLAAGLGHEHPDALRGSCSTSSLVISPPSISSSFETEEGIAVASSLRSRSATGISTGCPGRVRVRPCHRGMDEARAPRRARMRASPRRRARSTREVVGSVDLVYREARIALRRARRSGAGAWSAAGTEIAQPLSSTR